LKAGNVVTVEPGIYLDGKFGVRIEDDILVLENGYENLNNLSKDLIIV
jgi:Xaa-Pro aminopeptidase